MSDQGMRFSERSGPEELNKLVHTMPKTVTASRWFDLINSRTELIPESVRIVLLALSYLLLWTLFFRALKPLASLLRILSEQMAAKISVGTSLPSVDTEGLHIREGPCKPPEYGAEDEEEPQDAENESVISDHLTVFAVS
ncbi:hypothetical protein BIW11_07417 [Tropilaelaps mercedesae]|uniref:Uncharacterized protein n=1 Tax=Tropilaelaps mercedesae TaxID=418985 RepID=A0A1V9XU59_9ACAR|nr:hypothetical protein BIW11_07417 [Tropilaelaps mercedesae]